MISSCLCQKCELFEERPFIHRILQIEMRPLVKMASKAMSNLNFASYVLDSKCRQGSALHHDNTTFRVLVQHPTKSKVSIILFMSPSLGLAKKKRQLQTTDKKDPVACPGPLLQQQRAERMGVVGCKKGVSMACYVGWQAHHRYIGYQPTRSYHQRGRKSDKCKQPTAPRPSNVRQFLKQAASCDLVAYNTYLILSGC